MTDETETLTPVPTEIVQLRVPAGQITPNNYNPNKMNDAVAQAERESIEKFGFIDPITVRRDPDFPDDAFIIIDGEHRWRIGKDLGITEFPVIVLDVTEEDAKKLTIVLNETRGDADVVLLGQLLAELRDSAVSVEEFKIALPYSGAELDHLLDLGSLDWDDFQSNAGGGSAGAKNEIKLEFDDAGTLSRFKDWVDILRRETDDLDDEASLTAVVADAIRRAALAATR